MDIHVVRQGDTLFSVARQYGVPLPVLASLNGMARDAQLVVGQALAVRRPRSVYTVAAGDTVYSVARRFETDTRMLYRNNYFLNGRSLLREGDLLVIDFADDDRLGVIEANAYAYPYIDDTLLDSALPYLSYLTPFTYGIAADGTLLPLNDDALLLAAARQRVAPLMHLSTLTEAGSFSNERASILLNSEELQEKIIQDVIETIRQKRYYGLDVDFEYVPAQERERYAGFIRRLRVRLSPLGCPVYVALAPKTRADQPGLLYEAHDYALLGAAADAVLLMTYEWGYTYGPPMAVAPLPQVRAVVDYAVSVIEPGKILLGVPLYGYDWPLPFVRGETRAESLSPDRAVERALRYRAEILFDESSRAPYFYYTARDGRRHVVWFEDARSFSEKLRIVKEYRLRGVGDWSLMRAAAQNWTVMNALYEVKTLI